MYYSIYNPRPFSSLLCGKSPVSLPKAFWCQTLKRKGERERERREAPPPPPPSPLCRCCSLGTEFAWDLGVGARKETHSVFCRSKKKEKVNEISVSSSFFPGFSSAVICRFWKRERGKERKNKRPTCKGMSVRKWKLQKNNFSKIKKLLFRKCKKING